MEYHDFIAAKRQMGGMHGFAPIWLPDGMWPHQRVLTDWAIRKGRAAEFADCGLGKTLIQMAWAENVVRHTNRRVLVMAPLNVVPQTVAEAGKFGIESVRSNDGKFPSTAKIVVTNYDRLHYFSSADFVGGVCDESSILKNFDGVTKAQITEFLRLLPHRLLCTATAAPNDYIELGTTSEALGELGYMDMLGKFFKEDSGAAFAAAGKRGAGGGGGHRKWRFRGHAERDFWRWVCSWGRAVRRPSDVGCSDDGFALPPLNTAEHIVAPDARDDGNLFPMVAVTREEIQAERRATLRERCERAAELISATDQPAIAWCHLNPEGDLIEKLIPGAVQVAGCDKDERKEEVFRAFEAGEIRVIVTKPSIAGFGLNWQHCAHQTFFPSHSFEAYYQCVRRSWRFGQKRPVKIDIIASAGEAGVLASLNRKAAAADKMFAHLVELMNDGNHIERVQNHYEKQENVPSWL